MQFKRYSKTVEQGATEERKGCTARTGRPTRPKISAHALAPRDDGRILLNPAMGAKSQPIGVQRQGRCDEHPSHADRCSRPAAFSHGWNRPSAFSPTQCPQYVTSGAAAHRAIGRNSNWSCGQSGWRRGSKQTGRHRPRTQQHRKCIRQACQVHTPRMSSHHTQV